MNLLRMGRKKKLALIGKENVASHELEAAEQE